MISNSFSPIDYKDPDHTETGCLNLLIKIMIALSIIFFFLFVISLGSCRKERCLECSEIVYERNEEGSWIQTREFYLGEICDYPPGYSRGFDDHIIVLECK